MNSGSDNYGVIYCEDDDEKRVYCNICDKLCIERFYKSLLKSVTHIKNNHNETIISINSSNQFWNYSVKYVILR